MAPTMHWLLALHLLSLHATSVLAGTGFSPRVYDKMKQTAECKAIRRGAQEEVVDIQLKYVNVNPGAPTGRSMVLIHGWPSLWSTWSHQIQEFQHDHHLIVPDLRGFGESTHPGNSHLSGTMVDMVDDLMCILDHARVAAVTCMGHDWGSSICYEAARLHPERIRAIIGVTVPYIPSAGPFMHVKNFVPLLPSLSYQLFFDMNRPAAIKELDADIRRTVRATLRTVNSPPPPSFLKSNLTFLGPWEKVPEIPPVQFFSEEEEAYFVEQYSRNGSNIHFNSTRLMYLAWSAAQKHGKHSIHQPVLAVYPKQDPVADWKMVARMLKSADFMTNLRVEMMDGAHWMHIENPMVFNRIVRTWLNSLDLP